MDSKIETVSRDILDQIDSFLQASNNDQKARVEKIKELIDFLNYNLRLTELSDDQKKDFVYSIEGYPLSDKQRKVLDESDQKQKDYYIDMWARSNYFRRCAWLSYLHGIGDIPSV